MTNFKYNPDGESFQVCDEVNKHREFILSRPQRDNLLQALCKAHKCQGGTIHQFVNIHADNYDKFVREYNFFCVEMSFVCETKKGFKKMAARVSFDGLKF